jgi:hypothetical protein
VWEMEGFVSPVISSAGRGLYVKTARRLVPPRWAALFIGAWYDVCLSVLVSREASPLYSAQWLPVLGGVFRCVPQLAK